VERTAGVGEKSIVAGAVGGRLTDMLGALWVCGREASGLVKYCVCISPTSDGVFGAEMFDGVCSRTLWRGVVVFEFSVGCSDNPVEEVSEAAVVALAGRDDA